MSQSIIPEWLRLKKEVEAQIRGMWDDIARLWDWFHDLDNRVTRLERKLNGKLKFHKDDHLPPSC